MPKTGLAILVFLTALFSAVQYGHAQGGVTFSENKGQWPDQVFYRTSLSNSTIFTETNGVTYVVWTGAPHAHHATTEEHPIHEEDFVMHAYKMSFVGGEASQAIGKKTFPFYENYFLGSDQSKWASNVAVHEQVILEEIYPKIDFRFSGGGQMKYDFLVEPGGNPMRIKLQYTGQNDMRLTDEGNLIIETVAGEMMEEAPYAYQLVNNELVEVACHFKLKDGQVSFAFPEGFNKKHQLIIDPILSFASYTGSTANNFGSTATFDNDGFLYGGGTAFSAGYPTTAGVVQNAFAGGSIDIGLSKWSLDGSTLVWSTYIGGNGNETPHSLVVNSNDELFVLGTSGSNNYPVSPAAFNTAFNGGTNVNYANGYGFSHTSGCDVVVTRLNNTGGGIIGSTYIGGSQNDGVNDAIVLSHNYGDEFRGEIALDAAERPVVATTTRSADAPVTPNAAQSTFGGGGQDGYLFRMSSDLSNLQYATFIGGPNADAGYGVQFDSGGNIFVTGGTDGPGMPMAGSPFDPTWNGNGDAYIVKYNPASGALIASTFLGTSQYDQTYFVQLDVSDDVYVVGQTAGNYPISSGVFNEPNSGQFLHKLTNDLSADYWSTVVGSGNGSIDFSPTAFLVSNCGQIYIAGWGGPIQGGTLSTNGLTTTPDAVQTTTTGGDLYLMLLGQDANSLVYATFFGGGTSVEHVDGGTSRFDKDGNVYHAVCAGCPVCPPGASCPISCSGNNDFPTTSNAFSSVNGAQCSCNLGVLKFNLSQAAASIDINGPSFLCLPNADAQFVNNSTGGSGFAWDFGDLNTSTSAAPLHQYTDTGTYIVSLILEDTTGCLIGDTAFLTINVYDPLDAMINPPDTVCPGAVYQLSASGGLDYQWFPTAGLSDPTIANPVFTVNATSTYSVVITDSCSTDTVSTTIVVSTPSSNAGPDLSICVGDSVQLQGAIGANLSWSPATGLSNPNVANPMASPLVTTTYLLQVTDPAGCIALDSMVVTVQQGPPMPMTQDTVTCTGVPVELTVSGGTQYSWANSADLSATNIPNPVVTTTTSNTYFVTVTNLCGSVQDSVFVFVPIVVANAWPSDTICPGDSLPVFASGGVTYQWDPAASVLDPLSDNTLVFPPVATTYTVTATDANGCTDDAQLTVDLFPQPTVDAGLDVQLDFGDIGQFFATGDGSLLWSPDINISCLTCPDPLVNPESTTTYTVALTDTNGCVARDAVTAFLAGTLYVPNAFTPDGDGINDYFQAVATEVAEFEIMVFNRWGELLWASNSADEFWDGRYNGTLSQIDTYIWKVTMRELNGTRRSEIGHVNLIR